MPLSDDTTIDGTRTYVIDTRNGTALDDEAPPIPARTPLERHMAPVHRPLKSPARLPSSTSRGSVRDRASERLLSTSQFDVAPPIPSRAPIPVHLSSCPPAPALGRDVMGRGGSNTSSPTRMVMIDARRNSNHQVLMQTTRGGRATIVTTPARSGKSSVSSISKGISANPTDSASERLAALSRWPIREGPPGHLPIQGTPQSRPRRANEYVDTPSLTACLSVVAAESLTADTSSLPEVFRPHGPGINLRDCREHSTSDRRPSAPASVLKWSEKAATVGTSKCQEGIVCSRCGRCRCSNCALPRELPRKWVGERECSAQCAVDVCTCMCCVRCLFFHTRKSEEDDYSDEPCACTEKSSCCLRWSLLSFLAFTCLPCLLCYIPARCALGACTSCYNSYHSIGCRCEHSPFGGQTSGTKGLLTPESESSSY